MTNSRSTKSALFTSVVAILLCCTMLLGTTFAWFTDTATSSGNKIQAGTLDVDLLVYDENSTAADKFVSVANSTEPIFNYTLWEPGYTQVETMKIANLGNLALKYQLNVVAKDVDTTAVHNLADVIDVYMCFGPNTATNASTITAAKEAGPAGTNGWWYCGTLTEMMTKSEGFTQGKLLPADDPNATADLANGIAVGEATATVALHMQETAGNEYQNLSLGNVDINLVATQWTYEKDGMGDNLYDANASLDGIVANKPLAKVTKLSGAEPYSVNATDGIGGAANILPLDVAYQFEPTLSHAEVLTNEYKDWHADFVVYANKDVEAESIALAGYYDFWCSLNNDNWVSFKNPNAVAEGEAIRLVKDGIGVTVSYEEICKYGNDGIGFQCGAADLTGSNTGTTMTVELRLYETDRNLGNYSEFASETGNYIIVGTFNYTF